MTFFTGRIPKTIVGGLLVVNMAANFKSPLREGITVHRNVEKLVGETVRLFEGLPLTKRDGNGLDALGIIVVSHTNIPGNPSRLVTGSPAPQTGEPLHYKTFLKDICLAFRQRCSVT